MSMTELKITIGLSPSLMAIVSAIVAADGISVGAEASGGKPADPPAPTSTLTASPTAPSAPTTVAPGAPVAPTGETELDAAGVAWSADKHASTKAKVGSGLWRMKVGVKRAPGEGEDSPNYVKPGATSAPAGAPSVSPAPPSSTPALPAPPAVAVDPNRPTDAAFRHDNGDGTEQWYVNGAWDAGTHAIPSDAPAAADDDEFAQFATGAAAPSVVSARSWTDADLSKLCNQAALAAGGPEKVKPLIAEYMPADVTPHSRHVPADKREEFAQKVEAAHGITYAAG